MTWVMWNLASFCLETVLASMQDRSWFALDVPKAQKLFWMHSMVSLGDEGQVEACFGLSDILLILMQDRCTVCVKHTIRSEIVLDAPDGTPR